MPQAVVRGATAGNIGMDMIDATQLHLTAAASTYLERLAAELDVAPSRYEEARNRYLSVGDWLDREESALKGYSPDVYVQGSFRLGTPIRPVNTDEHYDIDLVCELNIDKAQVTQQRLKEMLGHEMRLYAKAHNMKRVSESRRCWTLEYADGAQFHLDALPALPDGTGRRMLLAAHRLSTVWAETAIAITDIDHQGYESGTGEWPHSNPKGFTNWFRGRMKEAFDSQRAAMALEAKASVEDIPSYRVKTPLQQAVQVLKRHRDVMFENDMDDKPISIIITTLAGLSYSNESNVGHALQAILGRMHLHIEQRGGVTWIENPTDPLENFADRWQTQPQRQAKFYKWLGKAQSDFANLAAQTNRERLVELAGTSVGIRVARSEADTLGKQAVTPESLFRAAVSAVTATHRKAAPWHRVQAGKVTIEKATITRNGFRTTRFYSNQPQLPKGASLQFQAKTDVPGPFVVYWQVVNTGPEAAAVLGGLRGGFDEGTIDKGAIVRNESTSYTGAHTIECFIVKEGYLVARSGAFIVNIV